MSKFKIALVSNTDFSLYNFRLGLIRALIVRGYEVHIICPDGKYVKELAKEGVQHHALYVDRKGTNPFNEVKTLWQLYKVCRKEKFDIVHNFTIKINIYGNMASKFASIPTVINSVTGLGYVFTEGGMKKRLLRMLVVNLYRFAFWFSKRVIFLNKDDFEVFQKHRIVKASRGMVLKGEGIDTDKFNPQNVSTVKLKELRQELSSSGHERRSIVTLITRILWDKGIREFVEAAKVVKATEPNVLFLLVGPIDTGNPAAVPAQYMQQAEKEGLIKYLGERRDIPEIMCISDIMTLPSYYREGIPRVLLEALSMEKPIVTTNWVGCKETVEEGKNGFLVPVKDPSALAAAIEKLIKDEDLRLKMGKYGRKKVLKEFDERIIVSQIMQLYQELLTNVKKQRLGIS